MFIFDCRRHHRFQPAVLDSLDRRITPAIIPWEAISWRVLFNGHGYSVKFDVAEPVRQGLRLPPPQRVLGMFNRLLRYPAFIILTLGTGLSAHQIGARLEGFKPAAA